MPASFKVDVEHEVIFSVYTGKVTVDEVRANVVAIRKDPRVKGHFRTLADWSKAASVDSRFGETTGFSNFYSSDDILGMTGRVAIYIPERIAVYGVLRQFVSLMEAPGRIAIFADMEEARRWLGLPPT